jgi:hypothetical protein
MACVGIAAVVLFILTAKPDGLTDEALLHRQFEAPGAPHMTASEIAEMTRQRSRSEQ